MVAVRSGDRMCLCHLRTSLRCIDNAFWHGCQYRSCSDRLDKIPARYHERFLLHPECLLSFL